MTQQNNRQYKVTADPVRILIIDIAYVLIIIVFIHFMGKNNYNLEDICCFLCDSIFSFNLENLKTINYQQNTIFN